MNHLGSVQETINKQGEEIRALMRTMQNYKFLLLRMRTTKAWLQNSKMKQVDSLGTKGLFKQQ